MKRPLPDPFSIAAFLVILVSGYIFYTIFSAHRFIVFTSEDQIEAQIQAEFPLLSQYLL